MEKNNNLITVKQQQFINDLKTKLTENDINFEDREVTTKSEASNFIIYLLKISKKASNSSEKQAKETASNEIEGVRFYYNGIKCKEYENGQKIAKIYYDLDSFYNLRLNVSGYYTDLRPIMEKWGAKIKNESDVYTDYFVNDSYIFTPKNKYYLQLLKIIVKLAENERSRIRINKEKTTRILNAENYQDEIQKILKEDNEKELKIERESNQKMIERIKNETSDLEAIFEDENTNYTYLLILAKQRWIDFSKNHMIPHTNFSINVYNSKFYKVDRFVFDVFEDEENDYSSLDNIPENIKTKIFEKVNQFNNKYIVQNNEITL